jgi:hypothetical protein
MLDYGLGLRDWGLGMKGLGMGTWDWEIPFTPPLEKGENKRGICIDPDVSVGTRSESLQ